MSISNPHILFFLILTQSFHYEGKVNSANAESGLASGQSPITLEDYLTKILRPQDFKGEWNFKYDSKLKFTDKEKKIRNYDITNGNQTVVFSEKNLKDKLPSDSYIFLSNDEQYALVEHAKLKQWRFSEEYKYDILDLKLGKLTSQLTPHEAFNDQPRLHFVQWTQTNGIIFIYKNNIFYKQNPNPSTIVRQLTHDGVEGLIYNGVSDWVYEEEMLNDPVAFKVSPTAEHLAFIKFNETNVGEVQWVVYGNGSTSYPKYFKLRYPKAGTLNPTAEVNVISLNDPDSKPETFTYPETPEIERELIGRIIWTNHHKLLVITLNRQQTIAHYHICQIKTLECSKVYTYKHPQSHGWIDMNTPVSSSINKDDDIPDSKFIFIRSVQLQNSTESFNHIVMIITNGTDNQTSSKIITTGRMSVKNILAWDSDKELIYFTASFWNGTHSDPSQSHVYAIHEVKTNQTCLTCNLTNAYGELCLANAAEFSPNAKYFIHRCNGPGVPQTTTRFTSNVSIVEHPGPTAINNADLKRKLQAKSVPTTKDYVIPLGEGFEARARLYLPSDFDETRNKTYPVLLHVYGGPSNQDVNNLYRIRWETTLVSRHDIIHVDIDVRGTLGGSTDHLYAVQRKLGVVEVQDQITSFKWLLDNLPFIDKGKTAIWGKSNGGYVTGKVLQTDKEGLFKCGISVAPVTSWKFYDSIYSERYMGLPTETDNFQGYENSSLLTKTGIENLRNKTYLLIHGNADDNVHYQNSMIYARALEQADVYFHQLSYPDENHNLDGTGIPKHYFHSMERFLFEECFHKK